MSTSLMGKLSDRANIVMSSFSEFEKTIIKATIHDGKPPKEKHVRRLIVYTTERSYKIPELINLLAKRFDPNKTPDWIITLKTLIVFHRLLRDGNSQFITELRYKSGILNLRKFADMSNPEAHHQSIFIRKYSQYLEEKVLVFKITGNEFEKNPEITKSYKLNEALEYVPRLQSQLNALLNCRGCKDFLTNSIIINAFTLLLKDSVRLYTSLNEAILLLLENYFSMSKEDAKKTLDIYKLFTKETDGLIQFFDICRKFSKNELPELKHAPTTLVDSLESYLKDLELGNTPSRTPPIIKSEKFVSSQNKIDNIKLNDEIQEETEDSDSDHNEEIISIDDNKKNNVNNISSTNLFKGQELNSPTLLDIDIFDNNQNNNQKNNSFNFDPFDLFPSKQDSFPSIPYDRKKAEVEQVLLQSSQNKPIIPINSEQSFQQPNFNLNNPFINNSSNNNTSFNKSPIQSNNTLNNPFQIMNNPFNNPSTTTITNTTNINPFQTSKINNPFL